MSLVRIGNMLEMRTVNWLRKCGWHAERVSRAGRYGGGDLFGCVDIVAMDAAAVELIQVTTQNGASARRQKIRAAALPHPIRLFIWKKDGRRWVHRSELIFPVADEAEE